MAAGRGDDSEANPYRSAEGRARASGFSQGFLVTAGIMLLALVITIRLRPADLREARL